MNRKVIILAVCSLLFVVGSYAQPGRFNQNNNRQRWFGTISDTMLGVPKDTLRTNINTIEYKNYHWLGSKSNKLFLWDTAAYKFNAIGFDSIYVRTSTDSVFGRFYGSEVFLYKKDAGAGVYVDSVYAVNDTLKYIKNSLVYTVGKLTNVEVVQDAVGAMINASLQYVDATPRLAINERDFGDIITTAQGLTWTIGEAAVTYDKMQTVSATNRVLGRMYSTGTVEELTGADLVNMIDLFTDITPGIVPASGGGTSNFLRADGTWAAPPGGGGSANANTGSGFRLLKPTSQDIKTLYNGFAVLIDSTSNSNGITFTIDTSLVATQFDILYKLNTTDSSALLANYLRGATEGFGIDITGTQHKTWSADTTSGGVLSWVRGKKIADSLGALMIPYRFGKSGEDVTPAENRSADFTSTYTMGLRHMSGFTADADSSISSAGYVLLSLNKSSNHSYLGTFYRNLTTNKGASLFESDWNSGNPFAQLISWKNGNSTTANYYRTYTDSLSAWLTSGSKYKVHNLPSGVGTKSIRYNPSNGEFTYADTTSGGVTPGIDDVLAVGDTAFGKKLIMLDATDSLWLNFRPNNNFMSFGNLQRIGGTQVAIDDDARQLTFQAQYGAQLNLGLGGGTTLLNQTNDFTNDFLYIPDTGNPIDTLATLSDVRAGGGGGTTYNLANFYLKDSSLNSNRTLTGLNNTYSLHLDSLSGFRVGRDNIARFSMSSTTSSMNSQNQNAAFTANPANAIMNYQANAFRVFSDSMTATKWISYETNINGSLTPNALTTKSYVDSVVGAGGTPSLTSTQIAYGDGSNLITSSSALTYDAVNGILDVPVIRNTSQLLQDFTSVSTPPSGWTAIYSASHGRVFAKNDAGTIVELSNVAGGTSGIDDVLAVGQVFSTGRTIDATTFSLTVTGSVTGSGNYSVSALNTSSGSAFGATSVSGIAILGASTSGLSGKFTINPSSTNSISTVQEIWRNTSGTAANGIGVAVDYFIETSNGAAAKAASMIFKWSDAATASRTAEIDILGADNTTDETFMNIQKDLVRINNNADTLATKDYARSVGGGGGGGGYTNLTQFVSQNNWKTFYSDGSGDVQELSLGAAGSPLYSTGTTSAPAFFAGVTYATSGTNVTITQNNTTDVGLLIQLAASSAEDAFRIKNSGGTTLSKFDKDGLLTLPAGSSTEKSMTFGSTGIYEATGLGGGLYMYEAGTTRLLLSGQYGAFFRDASTFAFDVGNSGLGGTNRFRITAPAVGTMQLGMEATQQSMIFKGTNNAGSDAAGFNMTIQPGAGTGNSTSAGNIIFQTPDAHGSDAVVQSYTTKFEIQRTGQLKANLYGSGTFTGTATKFLAVTSAGLVIEENAPGGASTFAALTDVNLTTITTNDFLKWDGTDWINRSPSQVRTDLSLVVGTNVQAWDADLDYLATFTPTANVKTILNAADYAAIRTALTLTVGTDVQAFDGDLNTIAGLTATTDNFLVSVASAWASRTPAQVRTTLALVIGTNVQAWDADLDTWASITPGSGIGTFLATPSSANLITAVTDETGTGALVFGTSPTLTTPRFANGGYIADNNGNELIIYTTTTSAVNELTFANGATGVNPLWTASGETNVGIDWKVKGTGVFRFLSTASGPTDMRWFEDTDNGSNYASVIAPSTLGSDVVITLPNASSTLPIFGQQITFTGPTAARTVTFPDANFTAARTDALNAFTGASTTTSWVMTSPTITTGITPTTDDGAALGTSALKFSDLFLASGAVIDFNNGNVVMTHTAGILTMGTGEFRITTVGTNTASVVTVGGTQTLTGKTIDASQLSGNIATARLTNVKQAKAIALVSPSTSEDIMIWFTDVAITITNVQEALKGSSPSVTYILGYASTRSGALTNIVNSHAATSTTGAAASLTANVAIPANSYIMLTTSATGGTINDLNVTINYAQQ